jgi:Hemerythrin HHE cation binding domain
MSREEHLLFPMLAATSGPEVTASFAEDHHEITDRIELLVGLAEHADQRMPEIRHELGALEEILRIHLHRESVALQKLGIRVPDEGRTGPSGIAA